MKVEPGLEEIRSRLEADMAALLEAVGHLTQDQADWRPASDRWSVGEVLHHLVLANRSFALQARTLIRQGRREGLRAREGARRHWPRLRLMAEVTVSGPVAHPAPSTPTPGLPLEGLLRDLAESHQAVAGLIPLLEPLDMEALRARHPLGFEMNLFQWVDVAGAHERRHLPQIKEIMAHEGFPPLEG